MLYLLTTLHDSLEIYASVTFVTTVENPIDGLHFFFFFLTFFFFKVRTELEFMLCSVTISWACLAAELFA